MWARGRCPAGTSPCVQDGAVPRDTQEGAYGHDGCPSISCSGTEQEFCKVSGLLQCQCQLCSRWSPFKGQRG